MTFFNGLDSIVRLQDFYSEGYDEARQTAYWHFKLAYITFTSLNRVFSISKMKVQKRFGVGPPSAPLRTGPDLEMHCGKRLRLQKTIHKSVVARALKERQTCSFTNLHKAIRLENKQTDKNILGSFAWLCADFPLASVTTIRTTFVHAPK